MALTSVEKNNDTINKFSEAAKNIILEFERKDAPANTLWHYRKTEHAEEIIREQYRYSDFKLLDDKQEVKLGHQEIGKLIGRMGQISRSICEKCFWNFMCRIFIAMLKNQSIYTPFRSFCWL